MFYNTIKTYKIHQKRDISGFIPACQRVLVAQWLRASNLELLGL